MQKFYDTCALLHLQDEAFKEHFYISSETLVELEQIKSSSRHDDAVKYTARNIYRLLDAYPDMYDVCIVTGKVEDVLKDKTLPISPDNIIIACAYLKSKDEEIVFVTDDIAARNVAKYIFNLNVDKLEEDTLPYVGYYEVQMDEDEMAYFYSHQCENSYGLISNQYLIIYDENDKVVDVRKWSGTEYVNVYNRAIKSIAFGSIKPLDGYQRCAIDSIVNNDFTILTGGAGSGKTLLATACAMNMIESGKFNRIVCIYNPVPARGTKDIGFLPGNKNEKAMDLSIGNILQSKFGSKYAVDELIGGDKLRLVSMSQSKGMEIANGDILFVDECQNTTRDMLKYVLNRAAKGAKIICTGDFKSQTDLPIYDGFANGLKRAIDVFKGKSYFGYVSLPEIWRSDIAKDADQM